MCATSRHSAYSACRNGAAEQAHTGVFEAIGEGEGVYRPLCRSTYHLAELTTLILSHHDHTAAASALEQTRQSQMTVIEPDRTDFDHTWEQFARYDDHELSFTDHMTGSLPAS